jgi:hypothetical protein
MNHKGAFCGMHIILVGLSYIRKKTTTKKISVLLGFLVIIMMLLYGPSIVVNSLAASPLSYKSNTSDNNSTNGTLPKGQQNQQSFSIQPCDKTHPCVSSTGPT